MNPSCVALGARVSVPLLIVVALFTACTNPPGQDEDAKRQVVERMREKTLAEVVAARPDVQREVADAPGYAAFSNVETKILFAGSGSGYGVHVNNLTGKHTYMKMAKLEGGFGVGLQDIRVLLVFGTKDVMERFVDKGWEFGVDVGAGAKSGDRGAEGSTEGSIQPIHIYKVTNAGVVAAATLAGTKYWPNKDLN